MANENSISSDLIRGHIDTIILRSLYDGDKHGNEICLDIEDKSGGQYEIKQPTLYSALKRLETSGLVNAYWASGVGGRRRYFKLTDEGRNVCEENFNLWIHSRNIIDKLISDGSFLGYPVVEPVKVQPEPEPMPKFDASEYENYTFNPTPLIEDDEFIPDEPIYQPVNDANSVLKSVDDLDPETKILAEENENNLLKLQLTDSDDLDVMQLSLISDPEPEEADVSDAAVEEPVAPVVEDDFAQCENDSDGLDDGADDYLVIEPYSAPEKEYGDILEKLFPTEPASCIPDEAEESADETEEEVEEIIEEIPQSEYEVKPTVTVAPPRDEPVIDVEEKKAKPKKEEPKNPNEIDYSDILSLAQMQGFRVKTADRTNYSAKGRLYVNKLNALSSTILYFIMIVEMFSICLPINDILGFTFESYLYGAIGLIVFPLFTYGHVIFNQNKTVDKLPSFKYCLSASIVTLLNLILLTFVFALIMQVDLYNAKNIMFYIIMPCVLFLNIPLYYIIKYLLVSKEAFFTRE